MKRNKRNKSLKEHFKNKLMRLIFEGGGPPIPWQPPEESPEPEIPTFLDPNETGQPIPFDMSPLLNPDPEDILPERPREPPNPHSPSFRPNLIPADRWHQIPNSNPPRYFHDLGNGYGQTYQWNPDTGQYEPAGIGPIAPGLPGHMQTPEVIPIPAGGEIYRDNNGNLYLRTPDGKIYYWDGTGNNWRPITDPVYLPKKPVWSTPNFLQPGSPGVPASIPGGGGGLQYIPNPNYIAPITDPTAVPRGWPGWGTLDRYRGMPRLRPFGLPG